MSNITTNEELLEVLNDEKVKLMIPVFVYVSVLMLVGTVGNILVLVFYGCKERRTTNSFFIVALAVFDLSICAITMPIEIMDLRFYYLFTNVPACKISRLINHFGTDASAATLLAIAADRYRRLCCPLKPQFELKHAKIAVCLAVFIAAILSWPAAVFYQPVAVNVTVPKNNSIVLQGSDCTIVKEDQYRPYLWAFNIIQFVIYIFATSTLIILYSLVGRAIYRYKGRRLKYASSTRSTAKLTYNSHKRQSGKENQQECEPEGCSSVMNVSTETNSQINESVPEDKSAQPSHSDSKENQAKSTSYGTSLKKITRNSLTNSIDKFEKDKAPDIRTIKCTVLMTVITVVYIVGYLPYLVLVIWRIFQSGYEGDILSDAGLVGFNIGIRSYLIVGCVNPLLYGGFNDKFRHFVFTLFRLRMIKKKEKFSPEPKP